MSKKIEDYLHLYIGCKAECKTLMAAGNWRNDGVNTLDGFWFNEHVKGYANVKPLLRPLSSMTEDEIVKLFLLKGLDYTNVVTRTDITDNFIQIEYKCAGELLSDYMTAPIFNPEQFHYLLSKHFDLFNLIESGLAIDKTTLNTI